jgi:methionyl-tRNA formyltransferase
LAHLNREIDLRKTAKEVYNLIRAVSLPYQGAFYKNVVIWMADFVTNEGLKTKYPEVGIYLEGEQVFIRLKDGLILSEDFEITNNQA